MTALKGMGLAALRLFCLALLLGGVLGGVMMLLGAVLLIGWGVRHPVVALLPLSVALTPLCSITSAAFLSKWAHARKQGLPCPPEERRDLLRACAAAAVALMMPLAWMAPSLGGMARFLFALDMAGVSLFGIPFRRKKTR